MVSPMRDVLDAGDGDDVARGGALELDPLAGPASRRARVSLHGTCVPSARQSAYWPPGDELAGDDAADGEPADVVVVVEVVGLELRRRVGLVRPGRAGLPTMVSNSGRRSAPGVGEVARRGAGARVRVEDREVELLLVGAEVDEEAVDLVEHLGRARVGAVDLVEADDGLEARLERLAEHEARLRQRALGGVDQQQHAVDHRERALDLAAEVGVARACRRC